VLGVAWSQVGPLALLVVITFVFTRVVPLRIPNYAVFVFAGLVTWTWFQTGIVAATECVVTSADLVRRPGFPLALLPVVAVGTSMVHYLLALPVLLVAVVVTTGRLPATVVALPVIITVQYVVMLGPAYLLAAVHARFRDTAHIVGVLMLPLFWGSAVFYDARSVPARFRLLFDLNPVAQLVTAHRDVLLRGHWPEGTTLATLAVVGAGVVVIGYRIFMAGADRFVDEL
jgi:lipopolysaccharide transport system permease protein